MIKNKKAYFNYEILESLEAGIVLSGAEVKAIRENRVNLEDAYVKVINDELWLVNANIAKFKHSGDVEYDATKSRKLLVKKNQVHSLHSKSTKGRMTLLPLKMYATRGKIKVQVGLGRGKKRHEKKNIQKERDLKRELHREQRKYMVK